jgi:hypothetical protein
MSRTYAVTWEEQGVPSRAGKLELLFGGLTLEGSNGGGRSTLVVPYDEIVGLRLAPTNQRLDGRPTLMIDRRGRGVLRLASIAAPGAVSEIAEELSALRRTGAARR